MSESEGFGKLLAALQAADLLNVLRGDGPFTVFAPTDEAFDAMPADELDELLKDTEALGTVLRGHVVAGELTADDLADGFEAETLDGSLLLFTVDGDTVLVNDAAIIETNDGPVNGIIHAIASILDAGQRGRSGCGGRGSSAGSAIKRFRQLSGIRRQQRYRCQCGRSQ